MQIKNESGKGRVSDPFIIYTMVPDEQPENEQRPGGDKIPVEEEWFEIIKKKLKEK